MTPQLAAAIAQQWRVIKQHWYAADFTDAAEYRMTLFERRIEDTYGVSAHIINRAVHLNGDWFDYGRVEAGEEAGQRF